MIIQWLPRLLDSNRVLSLGYSSLGLALVGTRWGPLSAQIITPSRVLICVSIYAALAALMFCCCSMRSISTTICGVKNSFLVFL